MIRMTNVSTARLRAWALGALTLLAASGATEASQCRIPRALLCENCARVVTLSLTPDGRCVVTAQRRGRSLRGGRDLIVRVQPASQPLVVARAHAPMRSAPGRCFVFQDRRYCE